MSGTCCSQAQIGRFSLSPHTFLELLVHLPAPLRIRAVYMGQPCVLWGEQRWDNAPSFLNLVTSVIKSIGLPPSHEVNFITHSQRVGERSAFLNHASVSCCLSDQLSLK